MPGSISKKQRPVSGSPLMLERTLASRWGKSIRTLQRWRTDGHGPPFLRIGGSVRYRLSDVLDYEARMQRGGEVQE